MLKVLRKKGVAKKILWAIAIIIIISFGFFGTAYLLNSQGPRRFAGEIFKKKIPAEEFQKIYEHTRIQTIVHYGEHFNKIRQFLNLEAETWDRLILLHEANKQKIIISDDEVIKTIGQYDFFKRDGQFDSLLYDDVLDYILKTKPRTFEESVRDNLKISKLYEHVTRDVSLNETEIFEAYKQQNAKIQLSYILISPDEFKDQVPFDEAKAKQYYQDHAPEFMNPPSVNVEYLTIPIPEGISITEKESLRAQAGDVYQSLLKTPSMAEIASQNNLELKESGFFNMEQPSLSLGWSYDVLNKIFQLKENEITEPFESSQGFLIIKMKNKKEAYIPEYAEIKEKIKDRFLLEGAKEVTLKKSEEYLKMIKEKWESSNVKNFSEIAQSLNLEIHQTPVFSRGQYLPVIGISKEFQQDAFSLTMDEPLSDVVEVSKGFCILHLDTQLPIDEEQYQKEKETFKEQLLNEKKNGIFSDFLTRLRLEANLTDYTQSKKDE